MGLLHRSMVFFLWANELGSSIVCWTCSVCSLLSRSPMPSESGQVSPVIRTGVAPCFINWAFPRTFRTYWEPVSSQFPSSPALWLVQTAQSVLLLPKCVTLCFCKPKWNCLLVYYGLIWCLKCKDKASLWSVKKTACCTYPRLSPLLLLFLFVDMWTNYTARIFVHNF